MSWAIRSPDHLGDGVMAIPAITSFNAAGIKLVVGPKWASALYPGCKIVSPQHYFSRSQKQRENIVLFKPSFGAAWRSRKHRKRVGLTGNRRRWLLTDPIERRQEHRIAGYNRLATHFNLSPDPLPSFQVKAQGPTKTRSNDILLIVGTNSPQTIRWKSFESLAALLGERAIVGGGPGDEEAVSRIGRPCKKLPTDLSISEFAAEAIKAKEVLGTDSGLTHLAAAARHWAGKDPKSLKVLYSSTDPELTGPISGVGLWSKRPPCWPCYAKKCNRDLICMGVSVESVMERLS